MADDEKIAEVYRKIERERALIHAASNMRQSTTNATVQARVDSNIRDSRKNIAYLEEKMRELQMRRMGGPGDRSDGGAPAPPAHGRYGQQQGMPGNAGPTPPPKDGMNQYFGNDRGDYGDPPPGGYSGNPGMMPPRAPYGDPRPYSAVPKARPNYSKLGKHTYPVLALSSTDMTRSHQIRHSISGPEDTTYAFATGIQA